jgi:hypothetical protein
LHFRERRRTRSLRDRFRSIVENPQQPEHRTTLVEGGPDVIRDNPAGRRLIGDHLAVLLDPPPAPRHLRHDAASQMVGITRSVLQNCADDKMLDQTYRNRPANDGRRQTAEFAAASINFPRSPN